MRIPDQPVVLHLDQDDPKKCTARKLSRLGKARLVQRFHELPHGAVVLDPFSETALSPADGGTIRSRGIVAVDCSWVEAERVFSDVLKGRHFLHRALPMLMASNPTKFGKWGELSTLEALAAAYYIVGERDRAEDLLSVYNWGLRFLEVNREPLDAYSECKDSAEVVRVQSEFY